MYNNLLRAVSRLIPIPERAPEDYISYGWRQTSVYLLEKEEANPFGEHQQFNPVLSQTQKQIPQRCNSKMEINCA